MSNEAGSDDVPESDGEPPQRSKQHRAANGRRQVRRRLNAIRHGLNTPVPDYMVQACADQYRALVDHVRPTSDPAEGLDLVYALAVHARLRARRAELMKSILEAGRSDEETAGETLRQALVQLGRLHGYERKSSSRLGGLLKSR